MKNVMLAIAALGLTAPAPALADPPDWAPAYGYHKHKKHKRHRDDRYRARSDDRAYARGYRDAQPLRYNTRVWRGDNGQYYCKRDDGTTGLIIGGVVGGLIGNEVAGRGDKTLGAIIGAAGGAILGRAIDRRDSYRCR
ncbi:MAG: glycine zipper 2TM domain-containing protein [Sphingomonadales bacterium]|nr:glycine zipper 2TM domain-containing protein [Sphingomonadales bacterium]